MLGAFTDCENIGCDGDEMIVDDDAAIDRDAGVSGDFERSFRTAGFSGMSLARTSPASTDESNTRL